METNVKAIPDGYHTITPNITDWNTSGELT